MRMEDVVLDYELLVLKLRKNVRGFGFSITGGLQQPSSCPASVAQMAHLLKQEPDGQSDGSGIMLSANLLSCLIRVRAVYPSEPAASAGLCAGDFLLQANDRPMIGMTSVEALNLMHSLKDEVCFKVMRIQTSSSPNHTMKDENQNIGSNNNNHKHNNTNPFLQEDLKSSDSPVGQMDEQAFDVTLVKKEGSLGFTIHKKEDGCLYVKEVIKEPAISDPLLTPGDRILLVNGVDAGSLSHEGAISYLRSLPQTVTLRLQPVIPEDIMQEIDAACSGRGSSVKKPALRHEARMMIKEKSVSPNGNTDSLSRLKLRKERQRQRSGTHLNNSSIDEDDPMSPTLSQTSTTTPVVCPANTNVSEYSGTRSTAREDRTASNERTSHRLEEHSEPHLVSAAILTPALVTSTPVVGTTGSEMRKSRSSDALLTHTPAASVSKHVVQIHSHDDRLEDGMSGRSHHNQMDAKRAKNCSSSITISVNGLKTTSGKSHHQNQNLSLQEDFTQSASISSIIPTHSPVGVKISQSDNDLQHKDEDPMTLTKWRAQTLNDSMTPSPIRPASHRQANASHSPSGLTLDGVEQDSGFGDCTPKATLEKPLRLSILKQEIGFHSEDMIIACSATDLKSNGHSASPDVRTKSSDAAAVPVAQATSREPEYLEVTFEKGWASRLGIQLEDDHTQRPPNACLVKHIVPNTIASIDARVKVGYKLLRVNDFDLKDKESKFVIDLLRKMKGKICMTFLVNP